MKMTFRWFGSKSDSVTLEQIRQIPAMTGLMGFLDYKPAGDIWTEEEIKDYIDEVHASGLECEVIESVNVHEDIKLGLPTRDKYIENYRITIKNLAKYGVKCIVYNFMPVLDWLRTDLARPNADGSTSMYYDEDELGTLSPIDIVKRTASNSNGFSLPAGSLKDSPTLKRFLNFIRTLTKKNSSRITNTSLKKSFRPARNAAL